jgi:hypothetical protein
VTPPPVTSLPLPICDTRPPEQGTRMHAYTQPPCFLLHASSTYKVDADGGDVRVGKGVVREPQEEAGLAHPGVPDQDELEEVVIITLGHDCFVWCVCVEVGGRRKALLSSSSFFFALLAWRRAGGLWMGCVYRESA